MPVAQFMTSPSFLIFIVSAALAGAIVMLIDMALHISSNRRASVKITLVYVLAASYFVGYIYRYLLSNHKETV